MSTIPSKRIRLVADAAKRTRDRMFDVFTSSTPEVWRGNDCQFEIGLFLNDVLIADISNIATLTLEVVDAATRKISYVAKTIAGAALDATLTQVTNWTDGTKQHAAIALTGTELNLTIEAGLTKKFWLIISMTTNDAPGRAVTIQGTDLLVVEDGTGVAGAPAAHPVGYYPRDVSDARFQQQHADGASIQFKTGQHPYIYNPDDGLWYPLTVRNVNGAAVLGLGTGEAL